MLENLNHLNFFGDLSFNLFMEDQLYFKSPQDCELNSLEIFFFQRNSFFFKMLIVIAFTKMHFDLRGSDYFIFFIFLWNLINLINYHSNESHLFHFVIINFQVDFYLPLEFHLYLSQEIKGYYLVYFKSGDVNFTFNSYFIIDNFLLYFLSYDYLLMEKGNLRYFHLVNEQSDVQEICPMNGKYSFKILILKQVV